MRVCHVVHACSERFSSTLSSPFHPTFSSSYSSSILCSPSCTSSTTLRAAVTLRTSPERIWTQLTNPTSSQQEDRQALRRRACLRRPRIGCGPRQLIEESFIRHRCAQGLKDITEAMVLASIHCVQFRVVARGWSEACHLPLVTKEHQGEATFRHGPCVNDRLKNFGPYLRHFVDADKVVFRQVRCNQEGHVQTKRSVACVNVDGAPACDSRGFAVGNAKRKRRLWHTRG